MANSDVDRLKNCLNRVARNYACFNFTKQYVYTTFFCFREFFYSWGWKISISALVLPVFWAFLVLGPIITSLATAREVILMGPWTGNAQKTGKTRRKWIFFVLRNQNSLKLKKVVYTTVYFWQSLFAENINEQRNITSTIYLITYVQEWNCT